ncbi:MarR family transcriptional regulator [Methanobacterium alcaliphilum]|uniref:MarR family transcriptional regulator n=1 Tax=Methanobacterium alcaliphilum TaxID=392018 RepID=UPI00200B017E|nr:MarR family transcriptional regulator [Methanobacterium alcaliphilum]MCK9152254.1 MarR family transcriptional regulator [Methanobacterium alcaliphilum]
MKDSDEIMAEYDVGDLLEMEKYTLVVLFLIQQRWSYIINKEFSEDQITTKQWLLLVILGNAFNHAPSMQEMAEAMSTTHQNVKQLATRLEDRGLLNIERDFNNKRILRLKVTDEYGKFWKKRSESDEKSIKELFNGLDNAEIKNLFEIMAKLEKLSLALYNEYKNR